MTDPAVQSAVDTALISVPSGQPVRLMDVILGHAGPEGATVRFRFLAPQIARGLGTVGYAAAAEDMHHLCQTYALPRATCFGQVPALVVISLSDIAMPFGATAPQATQYFEAFTLQGDACIWENI